MFVVFAGKKQSKQVGKMLENWKKSTWKWWRQLHKFSSLESAILDAV